MAKKVDPHWPSGCGGCACKGHWYHNLPDWSPHRRFSPAGSAKLDLDRLQYNTYCRFSPRLWLVPPSLLHTRPNHATLRSAQTLTFFLTQIIFFLCNLGTPNSAAMGCSQPQLSRTGLRNILAFLKVELQHFLGGTRALLRLPGARGVRTSRAIQRT